MRIKLNLITGTLAIFILTVGAFGQSTNPSSPTPVGGQYVGKGPMKETNFYYSFTAGPGDVSVGLEIKARDYSTFARIEIGNDPSNLIAMANMNASTTTGSASVKKDFKLDQQQTVRIKLTLDGNLAEYKLTVNGAGGGPKFSSGNINDGNSGNTGGKTGGAGKTGSAGKIGKQSSGSGSKLGAIGSGGENPKFSTQSSGGGKLSFTCPNEVMFKIVPVAGWDAGMSGQKKLLFVDAGVVGNQLTCNYTVSGGSESATIHQPIKAGYKCEVYNSGPKSRIFECVPVGVTAGLTRQRGDLFGGER